MGGGSMSERLMSLKDRNISSIENGMLKFLQAMPSAFFFFFGIKMGRREFVKVNYYLESTSSKKELLGILIESSAIIILILPIT